MLGPVIIGYSINSGSWANGYLAIAAVQYAFIIVMFFTWGWWKKDKTEASSDRVKTKPEVTLLQAAGKSGAVFSMAAFFCYVSYESTAGIWASSFLSSVKNMTPAMAAGCAALFYGGITLSRFLSGFLSGHITSRRLIRFGITISLAGTIIMMLPFSAALSVVGLFLAGFGCGPYYPTMISETPVRFGKTYSSAMVGLQMGSAYVGSMLIPSVTGWLSSVLTLRAYPWILLVFGAGALLFAEKTANRRLKSGSVD